MNNMTEHDKKHIVTGISFSSNYL